jgi:hypothetical protein
LFNTEGTQAVNTNHTNGSPFEDSAQQSGQDSSDSLSSNQASGRDGTGGADPAASQPRAPHHESAGGIPESKPVMENTAPASDHAMHSVEGVSSIQKMVHAMEGSGAGYVDEVIDMEPRERASIEFRVTCSGSPVRRLRLTGNRYTFGSADGCSIRLSDDTLRPMHAVLLRDASRIIVRAYSVPVQVNGTRTTEATLSSGDVLRLGQYQFELLSVTPVGMNVSGQGYIPGDPGLSRGQAGQAGTASGVAGTASGEADMASGVAGREPRGAESFAPMPRTGNEARSSRFSGATSEGSLGEDILWRDRLRREVDQWRERQIECDLREGRVDERESELRNRETELWSRAENLHRREARLQSQETANFQLYDEFSQRQQELLALREENRLREEGFHAREIVLRDQELQYRSQLEEATRRLHQSQQQADAAAGSVAEMREQFESLNTQIEQLSIQHVEIEAREETQRSEHEQHRKTLELARDQAVQEHAASENRRQVAEEQVAELEEQIVHLRATHGSSESEQLTRLSDSEAEAESLRQQVEELQQMVSEARNEAEVLRADYEQARSSVQQLESIVSESQGRGNENREQWIAETSELRSAVEKLSSEMAQANHELNQLREANEDLNRRLTEVQQERDQARQEMEARPSQDEVDSLRGQLQSANEHLGTMQLEQEQTLVRLEAAEQQGERVESSDDPKATDADAVWGQVGNVQADVPRADSAQEVAQGKLENQRVDESETTEQSAPDQQANANSAEHTVVGEQAVSEADPDQQDNDLYKTHLENEMRVDGELPDGDQIVDGSLASKLIQDFEAEDDFSSSRSAQLDSSLDAFSNLTYSGEERDGLSFTGYVRPESEDWSAEAETSDQESETVSDAFDESDDLAGEATVGLYESGSEVGDEVDGAENDHDHQQQRDRDIEVEADATELDEHPPEAVESSETAQSTHSEDDSEEDDDTIEAYMNRLLKHVRGDGDQAANDKSSAAEDNAEEVDAAQEEDLEPLDPNAPLVPRSLAPERDTDLNAMRELANTSARIAIKRSARLQSRNTQVKGLIRLVYALGAISCGAVCYMFLIGFPLYMAAAMTGVVAVVYIREAMQLFQEASYQYNAATNALQDEETAPAENEQYADE